MAEIFNLSTFGRKKTVIEAIQISLKTKYSGAFFNRKIRFESQVILSFVKFCVAPKFFGRTNFSRGSHGGWIKISQNL